MYKYLINNLYEGKRLYEHKTLITLMRSSVCMALARLDQLLTILCPREQ